MIANPTPITVDGPAASGKGTLARALASHLDYAHLDTGQIYRHVAYMTLKADGDVADEAGVVALAQNSDWQNFDAHAQDLRSPEVSQASAIISAYRGIRQLVLAYQRQFAAQPPHGSKGAVLDGRDIGTVVCPQAPCKFFVTADLKQRAYRRWLEGRTSNPELTQAMVQKELAQRDAQDEQRVLSPLRCAKDAHQLNTSQLSIEETLHQALNIIASYADKG